MTLTLPPVAVITRHPDGTCSVQAARFIAPSDLYEAWDWGDDDEDDEPAFDWLPDDPVTGEVAIQPHQPYPEEYRQARRVRQRLVVGRRR